MSYWLKKVFRLRACPGDADESALKQLLSSALGDVSTSDIQVQSLAKGYGLNITSRTATLMFRKVPALLSSQPDKTTWRIPLDEIRPLRDKQASSHSQALVLDIHFEGLTPLNDVEDDDDGRGIKFVQCSFTS